MLGKLRSRREYWEVDAVVISHMHADHILDLVPYASALTYSPRQQPVPVGGHPGTDSPARPRLIAPAGAAQALSRICAGAGMRAEHVERAFELTEYAPHDRFELGGLQLALSLAKAKAGIDEGRPIRVRRFPAEDDRWHKIVDRVMRLVGVDARGPTIRAPREVRETLARFGVAARPGNVRLPPLPPLWK